MSRECYMLVQRKSVQNVQERPGIYTGFVKVDIEISKNVKIILKLQSVFKEIWTFIEEHENTRRLAKTIYIIIDIRVMYEHSKGKILIFPKNITFLVKIKGV